MHGNVPFGMSGREAASYAHKALDMANKGGTAMMMWLFQYIMQMLMELLQRHHEKHQVREYDQMMTRLQELERIVGTVRRDLETEGGDSSQEAGPTVKLGDKMVNLPDNLEEGLGIMNKSQAEKDAFAQKLIQRYNEKHGIEEEKPKGPKGPSLEM